MNIDPNLVAALAALGAAQESLSDDATAVATIKKAYRLHDRQTDWVRYQADGLLPYCHWGTRSSLTLPRNIEVSGVFPHAHWRCKDLKIDAHPPTGETTH